MVVQRKQKVNLNDYKYRPLITRDDILEHTTQEAIFDRYLDYPGALPIGKTINSPFRKDNIPSFGMFYNSSRQLIYNDFALGGGDCFQFVKYLHGLRNNYEVYSRIAIDFMLDAYFTVKEEMLDHEIVRKPYEPYYQSVEKAKGYINLEIKQREWMRHDKKFWLKYGINRAILEKYGVVPISHIFYKSEQKEKIIKADKHAYAFPENKDDKLTFKIYQPFSKYKWMNNHNYSVWQGWSQLPEKGNHLIITKSLKDIMSIVNVAGVPATALQNEGVVPKESVFTELTKRFNYVFLLYDNDFDKKTNYGQIAANKFSETHNVANIIIPTGYKSKDFSDLVEKVGAKKARNILHDLLIKAKLDYVPY